MPYVSLEPDQPVENSRCRIFIFTEGTVLGPRNKLEQFAVSRYVPIGGCVSLIRLWREQGAEICYITSRKTPKAVGAVKKLLLGYGFAGSRLYYRASKQAYSTLIEEARPDILIEDDCQSIGGAEQMCITHVKPAIRQAITSIAVNEFAGIDPLPPSLDELLARQFREGM